MNLKERIEDIRALAPLLRDHGEHAEAKRILEHAEEFDRIRGMIEAGLILLAKRDQE